MMKIIYTRPDGGVSVVHPADVHPIDVEKALEKLPKDAINPQVVKNSTIPQDRTFRNAWQQNGYSILHNMEKCREIHRDRIRQAREPVLEALDVDFIKALESADTVLQAQIVAQKQALRDAPADPFIESAQTPEELKSFWPDGL